MRPSRATSGTLHARIAKKARGCGTLAQQECRGGSLDPFTLEIIDPIVLGGSLALVVFVGILVLLAVGRRLGQRTIARYGVAPGGGIGSLEAAVFALLGLMIAFT